MHDYEYVGGFLIHYRDYHLNTYEIRAVFKCKKCDKVTEKFMNQVRDLSEVPTAIFQSRVELYDKMYREDKK